LKRLPLLIGLYGVLHAGTCSFGETGKSRESRNFSEVYVSIYGFDDARVGALLIDHEGRRTGWTVKGAIQEIPGCWDEYSSEVGIPEEDAIEDTVGQGKENPDSSAVENDSSVVGPANPPKYHIIRIFGPSHRGAPDSPDSVGIIPEGGCELRLEPIVPGRLNLAITGNGGPGSGIGISACQDTASVIVKAGVNSRWWLSWKTDGNKCFVKLAKLSAKESKEHRK